MTAIDEFESVLVIAFLILGACLVTNSVPFAPDAGVVGWSGDCPRTGVAQFNEPMRDGDCPHLASSSTERR